MEVKKQQNLPTGAEEKVKDGSPGLGLKVWEDGVATDWDRRLRLSRFEKGEDRDIGHLRLYQPARCRNGAGSWMVTWEAQGGGWERDSNL